MVRGATLSAVGPLPRGLSIVGPYLRPLIALLKHVLGLHLQVSLAVALKIDAWQLVKPR